MNPSVNRFSKLPHSSEHQPPEPPEQAANSYSETTSSGGAPEPTPTSANAELATPPDLARQQPIPPPSEPMQYRAIGLVRGQYMPSAEQFTRGTLLAADETLIDAVLLGRVMSLVKNHLSLDQSHLWVVYPRTRQEDGNLHVQIVGVWEPERLQQPSLTSVEEQDAVSLQESIPTETQSEESDVEDGYFSVRGAVIYQSREEEGLIIKIKQAPRKGEEKPKFFKLKLKGVLADKAVGHFWDFQVQRQENSLVIQEGKDIGLLPVKKRRPPFRGGGGGRPSGGKRPISPSRAGKGERPATITPPKRREPVPKPIKRQGRPPEK